MKQTSGLTNTNYLWDEQSRYGDVVLETDGSGSIQASYTLGASCPVCDVSGLLSQKRGSTTSYYLEDGQGSVRALTDASGNATDSYSYDAYGQLLNHTGTTVNPYLYTGQQYDALTELYDLRARYYAPTKGRFLSQDTYPVNFNNPIELNRYGYVAGNPVNYSDPSGNNGYGLTLRFISLPSIHPLTIVTIFVAVGLVGALLAFSKYGNIPDPPNVGPYKDFTVAQKKKIYEKNKELNGGKLIDDDTGEELVEPQKSQKGVSPPPNEAQVDHYYPKSKGGSNSYKNAKVISRASNRAKSDSLPDIGGGDNAQNNGGSPEP